MDLDGAEKRRSANRKILAPGLIPPLSLRATYIVSSVVQTVRTWDVLDQSTSPELEKEGLRSFLCTGRSGASSLAAISCCRVAQWIL